MKTIIKLWHTVCLYVFRPNIKIGDITTMQTIVKKFEKMGARAKYEEIPPTVRNRFGSSQAVRLNIARDKKGAFFQIESIPNAECLVLDVQPKDRHLLLMIKLVSRATGKIEKDKFLCGHDERDWFIARIPGNRSATNVITAKEALKPNLVLTAQETKGVRPKNKNRRRNEAFIRQGEWFFIPAPEVKPMKWVILQDEPVVRTRGGKPHMAEFLYRIGGKTIYTNPKYPRPLSENEYRRLLRSGEKIRGQFRVQRLDPMVYVKGRITHADHKTVLLDGWHRVVPNTETTGGGIAMGFID